MAITNLLRAVSHNVLIGDLRGCRERADSEVE